MTQLREWGKQISPNLSDAHQELGNDPPAKAGGGSGEIRAVQLVQVVETLIAAHKMLDLILYAVGMKLFGGSLPKGEEAGKGRSTRISGFSFSVVVFCRNAVATCLFDCLGFDFPAFAEGTSKLNFLLRNYDLGSASPVLGFCPSEKGLF
ncbi:hypothetical protein CB1_000743124 [Camelus ferus]|nr:hypothetical protein CB1_000743124 [Camelus ferus]